VLSMAVFDDGSGSALYVGGTFTSAGGNPASGCAKWDGIAWSPVGNGVLNGLKALAVYDSGSGPELYAGFGSHVYKLQSGSWAQLSWGGLLIDLADALETIDDGMGPALYAGGAYVISPRVAKWDGVSWTMLANPGGQGPSGEYVTALSAYDDGSGTHIYAGTAVPGPTDGISRWDGSAWTAIGTLSNGPSQYVHGFGFATFDDGTGAKLFACGDFSTVNGIPVNNIAKWDGASWSAVDGGANGRIYAVRAFDDGGGPALYAGGSFTSVNGTPSNRIGSWGLPSGCIPTGAVICEPSVAGMMQCPCANPPAGPGRGCDNSSGTGGGVLTTTGFARLGTDNLAFVTSSEKPGALSIVLQGSAPNPSGATFGQGVRCVAGSLKRLYVKSAVGGSITAPGPGDLSVSARSAALGDVIAQGTHRFYGVYYRDPVILGGCPAGSTFNITQQLDVLWHP
jgi:hypothetical protein